MTDKDFYNEGIALVLAFQDVQKGAGYTGSPLERQITVWVNEAQDRLNLLAVNGPSCSCGHNYQDHDSPRPGVNGEVLGECLADGCPCRGLVDYANDGIEDLHDKTG